MDNHRKAKKVIYEVGIEGFWIFAFELESNIHISQDA
jgi:hypothetical protein